MLLSLTQMVQGEVNCHDLCNTARGELNAAIPCRQWRKTLPRPKVGNACRTGYQEAVTDACFATCTGEQAINVVSQACRQFRGEMPKPVMFNSCETGYNAGFSEVQAKVAEMLKESDESPPQPAAEPEPVQMEQPTSVETEEKSIDSTPDVTAPEEKTTTTKLRGDKGPANEEIKAAPEPVKAEVEEQASEQTSEQASEQTSEQASEQTSEQANEQPTESISKEDIVATLPVNIDDHDVNLIIHRGEEPADAVKAFCAEHMSESGEACQTQLLPHVLGKLAEKGMHTTN